MTVDLTLLGAFSARHGGTTLALPTRKAQALLAYLALAPAGAHEREKLCGLLWGETGRPQAYSSLRQTLFGIRKALPAELRDAIVANGRTVALDPSRVRSDAGLLQQRVSQATRAGLEEAASLYRGPLLEGFAIEEPSFEEWLTAERNRFAELASSALGRLALLQAEEGALDRAVQTRQLLLRLEPWEEDNHRALMQLHVRQGRRSAALAQYQQCLAVLERELGIEPELATKQLYEEIVGLDSGALPGWLEQAKASAASAAGAHHGLRRNQRAARSPLVGREQELLRLSRALEQAWAGHGQVALLVGEAGVGKTRLLEELASLAEAQGGIVVRGRCFESEQVLPLSPWVDALRRESAFNDPTLWSGLAPAFRTELTRLLPLGEETRSSDIPSQDNALRLLEAVHALLRNLAQQRPLFLVLDDLQWADAMSLRLLSFLGRRLSTAPRIFIAASVRQEELPPASLLATALGELAREDCSFNLRVPPLSQPETVTLVQSLRTADGSELEPAVYDQIWALSEGNPFVVVEAVRALSEGALAADVAELPVPERVRDVITGHVKRLTSLEQQLVAVAAVIGREFEFALLRTAAEAEDVATAAAVEELVRIGIFKVSNDKLYFAHERIREVVYEGLLGPRRMVLHGHVARALSTLHAGALQQIYGRLAFHYGKADEPRAAVHYLAHFAEDAARTFGLKEALAALSEANQLTERLPPDERAVWRLEIAVRNAKCLFHLRRFVEIRPCLEPHLSLLETLKRPELSAQVHFWLGCADALLGNTAAASSGERALAAALSGKGVKTARRAHTLLAWEAAFAGRFQKGIEHGLSATVSLSAADAEPEYISSGWMTAGVNYLYAGQHAEALSALEQARAIAEAAGVPRVEALALGLRALTHAELDEPAQALDEAQRAVHMAPDPMSTGSTLSLLAHVHVRAGRADDALHVLRSLVGDALTKVRPNQSGSLLALAEAYLLKGALDEAQRVAERTLSAAREAGHPLIAGAALRILGQSAHALLALDSARDSLEQSRGILESIGAPFQLGRTLCALAAVAQHMGDTQVASARLSQAEQLYRGLSLPALASRVGPLLTRLHASRRAPAAET